MTATTIAADPKAANVVKDWQATSPLVCCKFDPAGKFAFAGGEDRKLARFDFASGAKVEFAPAHDGWPMAFVFVGDGKTMVSAGGDGTLIWWPALDAAIKPIRKVAAHDGWARCLAASPDRSLLASGGNDGLVKIWAADGKPVRTLAGHPGTRVYSLLFHPDGKTLLSGDLKGDIREWNLADGKLLGSYPAKELHTYEGGQMVDFGGVRGMAISPDKKRLVACGLYKASNPLGAVHEPLVLSFNPADRKKQRNHVGAAVGVAWYVGFLADGMIMTVIGGNAGGALAFWKADVDKEFHRFALPNTARAGDLSSDGLHVLTAHHDRRLRVVRLAAATPAPAAKK